MKPIFTTLLAVLAATNLFATLVVAAHSYAPPLDRADAPGLTLAAILLTNVAVCFVALDSLLENRL